MTNLKCCAVGVASACALSFAVNANAQTNNSNQLEEIEVISERLFNDTNKISPTASISAEDLKHINFLTAEDSVAYEPSIVVRRRYIGDPNGVLGIRGSGMFQTARSLVYADGLPLHYLLQTRWSGSPRWSLVGPDEIANAQVIYGPFSAEYSGNAMGGVVDIKTHNPMARKFTVQGTLISQDYDVLGTNDKFNGSKVFVSYEDRIDNLSVFASYNRLDNQSQPQTNYYADQSAITDIDEQSISGYIRGKDDNANDVIYIGDSGSEKSISELYKVKLGYDFGNMQVRFTGAFEEREREANDKNNYLKDQNGNPFWGLGNRNFDDRSQQRDSLLLGLGVSGELDTRIMSSDWVYDVYATDFEIRKDEERRSGLNPQDPEFGSVKGRLTAFGDTGWNTLDVKLGTDNLFDNSAMRLSLGYQMDSYELAINPSDIDAVTGAFIKDRKQSGGETGMQSLFAQWGYAFADKWDLALGLRYEDWESKNGFFADTAAEDRSKSGLSPKFSLAYQLNENSSIRYSAARALRFPIAEELFRNEEATNSIIRSDASLAPEDGVHHNLAFEHQLDDGSVRVNIFYDDIKDNIFNQTGTINDGGVNVNVSTFLAIDRIENKGIDFILNKQSLWDSKLGMRFNLSYIDAKIITNDANPEIEGNVVPRVPKWRANLILAYAMSESVDLSSSIRYSSNAFGDLANTDTQKQVYGAIDRYVFVNAKAQWRVSEQLNMSLGIDNIFDELAYVAHPYPSRTVFLEGKLAF